MKKAIIFYISDFGGHSKAAINIEEAFKSRDNTIEILNLNGFAYFYPRWEKIVDFLYISVIKHFPHIWGKIYDRQKIVKTLAPYRRFVNKCTFRELANLIRDFNPDCFVATQAFPCGIVADYKATFGLKTPLIAVVTDYYPHRFWIHPFVDQYIVASEQAKDYLVNNGVSPDKIKIFGIPISIKFLNSFSRAEISSALKFQKELDSVLVMGGGLGIGPIKTVVQQLDNLKESFQIIVVCGKNKNLYNWFLRNKNKFIKPIYCFGYVDCIYKIMDYAQIIITKGGGITVSEALAKGLAIVITQPIPGQEERNVNYLLSKEAIVKADNASEVVNAVKMLLNDKKKMDFLHERARAISFVDSSLRIVDLIFDIIKH